MIETGLYQDVFTPELEQEVTLLIETPQLKSIKEPGKVKPSVYPVILAGPWTAEGKQIACEREMRGAINHFQRSSRVIAGWTPDTLPSMADFKNPRFHKKLQPDTIKTGLKYAGIEFFVKYYTQAGLGFANNMNQIGMALLWGQQEYFHNVAILDGLEHDGAITERGRNRFENEIGAQIWVPGNYKGLDLEFGYMPYGIGQENRTGGHYDDYREMIRTDYGLPMEKTPEEKKRGYEFAMSGVISTIRDGEGLHESQYWRMFKIMLKYYPGKMLDALYGVQKGFRMPTVEVEGVSDEDMIRIVYAGSSRAAMEEYVETFREINHGIQLNNRAAVKSASNNLVQLDTTGMVPSHMIIKPNGDIEPIDLLAA
jgi:hypothetical protein